ncbi:MAG: 3-dehydroquinate synthase [Fimbriimonas sp.]|nr:3-dehydroquinate synthase [Fimbriimonas sp.]
MKAITIDHRTGSCEVRFEPLASALVALPSDVRVITDVNVAKCFGERLSRFEFVKAVTPGERSKSNAVLAEVVDWLATTRASRKTTVCAFGGGVVGDLAGFAAAVYMRGVPLVQIPTTLLSQVDSSVGGKVGIDLPAGKNLMGAFYPAISVSVSHDALETLPDREFRNGMAEVWKYGFIMDADLVMELSRLGLQVVGPELEGIVERCIRSKALVVQEDEFETLGRRAILNFGHTVGHAIEFVTGYGPVLHGEAISIGMVVEARIGEYLGLAPSGVLERVRECLVRQGLPITHPSLQQEDGLIRAMYGDKKASAGQLALSLLTEVGHCKLIEAVDESIIRRAMRDS